MSKHTSLVTTLSGILGGTTKVAQEVATVHSTESIDFVKVVIAAAVSACVGYVVKLLLDIVVNSLKKRNNEN